MAARRPALGEALRSSLDRLGITSSAAERRRIGRTIRALTAEDLPGAEDYETLLYPAGVAWVRQVAGRSLWLLYRFDADEVMALVLIDRQPVRVGD